MNFLERVIDSLECCDNRDATCNGCLYDKECCGDAKPLVHDALTAIRDCRDALRIMVYQYCTDGNEYTKEERFNHMYMSAGETAFEVLGIHNGDIVPEDWLWPKEQGGDARQ